ncbi:MAG: gamma-glutamyltransferase [Sphingomonadales bacterium]
MITTCFLMRAGVMFRIRIWTFVAVFLVVLPVRAADRAILDYDQLFHPVVGLNGMVSSQEAVASAVGLDILKKGGNAVDAAVAVGFALAVTLPKAGNLGGGGFMLVHLAEEGKTIAIDYREQAPARAGRDMFLDPDGEVNQRLTRFSHLSAGVPGTVAGLAHVLERHGTMPLDEVLAPAIELAENGIVITHALADSLGGRGKRLRANPASLEKFFKPGGEAYRPGDLFKQPDLAWTLRMIARHGANAFYKGAVADKIVAEMKAHGGLVSLQDLAAYKVVEREPVRGAYRGIDVISMPPPSSGGVHIIQMLNILEGLPLRRTGHNSAQTLHYLAETMKLAYADRGEYLGDPDFYDVPVQALTSRSYAERLRAGISADTARPSSDIKPGRLPPRESPDTTHFSVMDQAGNAVANTYTLNFSYGSGITVAGAGFLLNNEMDDFSAKPGTPNAFGLIGGAANAIEPGKRPLSSMTPTMLFKDGKPFLVTGSPGGSTIITVVLQVLLNVVDHGMNIAAASSVPRIHHQWLPDQLFVEPGVSPDTVRLLQSRGHTVKFTRGLGSTESITWVDGVFYGASDPRRPGAATYGF